tara:strand:- start:1655 stop:5908 length:4254 start_codon:yes stop_codon:yes gene_type:complete
MILENKLFINMKMKQILTLSLALITVGVLAKENVPNPNINNVTYNRVAAGCSPSSSQTDMDVNNVRATILGGGDMWWNLSDAQYEIPKGGGINSLFAGSLWIGGVDAGGQLKVAAMTYRQGGNDFWPGPLDVATATITEEECNAWDKHFKIDRSDVEEYVARFGIDPTYTDDMIPSSITDWPAHGNGAQDHFLAPYFDANGNGFYEPYDGDYPDYNITGDNDQAALYGDQTLWWIFNDKGNIHTETEADPIGLEIHAQAFGFTADNEINDMTFYNYKIINRSTLPLTDVYFGQWVDADLGFYLDDYVGCDVNLGLGFCYNGDAEDEGAQGYGFNPPAIGVDFFQGPLADANDGLDNDRDGIFDEPGEQIIMSKFVYYNNDNTVRGNPNNGTHIYNYLRGIWKDNVPMTFGGDGKGSGPGATTDLCNFMFPGVSDPMFPGQEWTEVTAGNLPADRRFLQSAGPFTLEPGAVNTITTGVVWARAKAGGNEASVQLVKIYDREAQALFDNNFNILNGPDAPDLTIREMDQELIISLTNEESSNNYNESYSEKDPYITLAANVDNQNYQFQGYLVYQLKDATASVTDLDDPDKARLVFRSDVKDDVTGIINQYLDPIMNVYVPVQEIPNVMESGAAGAVDQGVEYSFKVTEDKFALGNPTLVNHKTYHYMSIAYGFNPAEINANPYDVNNPLYDGRNQPHISGRRNIQTYSAIPHQVDPENGGTVLGSHYGDGVRITRIEGVGNGGNTVELDSATVVEVIADGQSLFPSYENGMGPITITVVDPLKIKDEEEGNVYTVILEDPVTTNQGTITSYAKWRVLNGTNTLITSTKSIDVGAEQLFPEHGFSIKLNQVDLPASDPASNENNGFISGTIEFDDPYDKWLSGVPDYDGNFLYGLNWIRSGTYVDEDDDVYDDYFTDEDPEGIYEGAVIQEVTIKTTLPDFAGGSSLSFEISGGTWAPYRFASHFNSGPAQPYYTSFPYSTASTLTSVDIVFTSDQTQWTRCAVVEASDDKSLAEGGQTKMGLRSHPSVDKNGDDDGSGTFGMGWFPGYAIDLESGERLNLIFSEDSWLSGENGRDMKWNPTSNIITANEFPAYQNGQFSGGSYLLGGKHFVYVIGGDASVMAEDDYLTSDLCPSYDEGAWIYNILSDTISSSYTAGIAKVFQHCTWVGAPLLSAGSGSQLFGKGEENTARVKLRVNSSYNPYVNVDQSQILNSSDELVVGNTYYVADNNLQIHNAKCQLTYPKIYGGKKVTHAGTNYEVGELFVATTTSFTGNSKSRVIADIPINNFNPVYEFNTTDLVSEIKDNEQAKSALDLINVVPNPYYGYSEYETSQLDNIVKITNLPNSATIRIFTVSGTLLKTIKKSDDLTSVDWDLKNDHGIPVASGLYVIHVRTTIDGKKQNKILKWFGVLRPIDLDTF